MLKLMYHDIKNNISHSWLSVCMLLNYRIGKKLMGLIKGWKFPFFIIPYICSKLLYKFLSHQLGCSLPFSANLGRGITFQHGLYGVFISGKAVIGNYCIILHQVTIGSNQGSSRHLGAPAIGDKVFIGAGAKVIGNIIIGDSVRIGANSLVCKNTPSFSTCYAPMSKVVVVEDPSV